MNIKFAILVFYLLNGNVASVEWSTYPNIKQCQKDTSNVIAEFYEYYPTYTLVSTQCVSLSGP